MSDRVLPSGQQWAFRAGDYSGTVVSVGGGLRGLSYDGREVVVGYGEDESAHAGIGQHMFPWPNRIADGQYSFGGEERQLYLTEPARQNAIHGLTRWANWERLDDGSDEAVVVVGYRLHGEPGYPHQLDLMVRYELDADAGLSVAATAENVGAGEAPYGYGTHPYLTVGRKIDGCELVFTAEKRLDVTEDRLLPVELIDVAGSDFDFRQPEDLRKPDDFREADEGVERRPRLIGELFVDCAFTGLPDSWTVRLTDPTSGQAAELTSDAPWMQLYSADAIGRVGLAVEPMTCPPNAFVTGERLITLKPGESHTTRYTIKSIG
jgi:aldose 1-epimerase